MSPLQSFVNTLKPPLTKKSKCIKRYKTSSSLKPKSILFIWERSLFFPFSMIKSFKCFFPSSSVLFSNRTFLLASELSPSFSTHNHPYVRFNRISILFSSIIKSLESVCSALSFPSLSSKSSNTYTLFKYYLNKIKINVIIIIMT